MQLIRGNRARRQGGLLIRRWICRSARDRLPQAREFLGERGADRIQRAVAGKRERELKSFVGYYLQNAPKVVAEVGYVALPERAYALGRERVDRQRTGSMFREGDSVGVSIEALLAREQSEKK